MDGKVCEVTKRIKVTIHYFNYDTLDFDVLFSEFGFREYQNAMNWYCDERDKFKKEGFKINHTEDKSNGLEQTIIMERVADKGKSIFTARLSLYFVNDQQC